LYLLQEGQVRIWPYLRANGTYTVNVLGRLRAEFPGRTIRLIWDGASYHRSALVKQAAADRSIELRPLPGYSPDFIAVEALWRWLREEVTYNHCHTTPGELIERVASFEAHINADPDLVVTRLRVKVQLDPVEEQMRIAR